MKIPNHQKFAFILSVYSFAFLFWPFLIEQLLPAKHPVPQRPDVTASSLGDDIGALIEKTVLSHFGSTVFAECSANSPAVECKTWSINSCVVEGSTVNAVSTIGSLNDYPVSSLVIEDGSSYISSFSPSSEIENNYPSGAPDSHSRDFAFSFVAPAVSALTQSVDINLKTTSDVYSYFGSWSGSPQSPIVNTTSISVVHDFKAPVITPSALTMNISSGANANIAGTISDAESNTVDITYEVSSFSDFSVISNTFTQSGFSTTPSNQAISHSFSGLADGTHYVRIKAYETDAPVTCNIDAYQNALSSTITVTVGGASPTPTTAPSATPTVTPPYSTPGPTTTPTPGPSTENKSCNSISPGAHPNIFQTDRNGGEATLYISPGNDPYTDFLVSYGSGPTADGQTFTFARPSASGVIVKKVSNLSPLSAYYFKVKAINGCKDGDWSAPFAAVNQIKPPQIPSLPAVVEQSQPSAGLDVQPPAPTSTITPVPTAESVTNTLLNTNNPSPAPNIFTRENVVKISKGASQTGIGIIAIASLVEVTVLFTSFFGAVFSLLQGLNFPIWKAFLLALGLSVKTVFKSFTS